MKRERPRRRVNKGWDSGGDGEAVGDGGQRGPVKFTDGYNRDDADDGSNRLVAGELLAFEFEFDFVILMIRVIILNVAIMLTYSTTKFDDVHKS
ncbi:hypothetical protein QVD17_34069 [Tagetes erecta]|uniref:Uncharacterized protein n=1 Tax=Tagetes erecta TaxID=13708 RepID=A0AAD8NE90_TARER|nr:hypothetical protein QVD17_34069 [Tagetes erecta]